MLMAQVRLNDTRDKGPIEVMKMNKCNMTNQSDLVIGELE